MVQMRATVLHISNIDVMNQTFTAKLRIHMRWACPEVDTTEAAKRLGIFDASWTPTWVPLVSLQGACSLDRLSTAYFVVSANADVEDAQGSTGHDKAFMAEKPITEGTASNGWFGTSESTTTNDANSDDAKSSPLYVRARQVLHVVIVDQLNLRAFPFDLQDFALTVRVDNVPRLGMLHDGADAKTPPASLDPAGMVLPDFALFHRLPAICRLRVGDPLDGGTLMQRALTKKARAPRGGARSSRSNGELRIVVFYGRKSHSYLYNFYVLLFLIGTCSLASHAIHWREVASRLSFDITVLLVAVAFKQQTASLLPPVAYLTLLDWYTLLCICFVTLSLLVHAIFGFLIFDCDTLTGDCTFCTGGTQMGTMYDFDLAALYAFLGLWIVANAVYVIFALRFSRGLTRHVTKEVAHRLGFSEAVFVRRKAAWWEDAGSESAQNDGGDDGRQESLESLEWLDLEA